MIRPALAVLILAGGLLLGGASSAQEAKGALPADLPDRYHTWLEEVAPLIGAGERDAFLALQRDYQRDAFIRKFWAVRDPFPKTSRNELQAAWEERAKAARERFGGLDNDRARMLLFNGEPDNVLRASCNLLAPLEIWSYKGTERINDSFSLVFVNQGGHRLWYPSQGLLMLITMGMAAERVDLSTIQRACPRGDDIAGRLAEALDWKQAEEKVYPRPSDEWLTTFSGQSTDVPAGAAQLPARVDLSFPGRYGSRTVVQTVVSVAREAGATGGMAEGLLVDGEVLRNDELFENFRYRFAPPANAASGAQPAETLPLVFQRYLRPGRYTFIVKVEDPAGQRFFREQRELEVPSVEAAAAAAAPAVSTAPAVGAPSAPAAVPALAEANAGDLGSDETSIRLLPPKEGLLTGKVRLEAITTGEGIARVSFELDGKPVLTKGKPPYSVELNLGAQPRLQRITARALAADGRQLAEDELQLNSGPHRFSIRLVEPQDGKVYRESLRAHAQVEVPEGETLERVELYLNDGLVATLYQPPFIQPILLPGAAENSYVRAVAYMKDGNSTEDLVLI
ncbi:MAG TPA: GWxTD domain-containing protein, partial [Thermoanaerobaculia bacterium]|nr:GWxTD domain-containing protein [Thermoanaerobaculia bacterium]